MKEQWRDIKGYEGLYQTSNSGRIKSLPRLVRRGTAGFMKTTTQIRITHLGKKGYERVTLSNHKGKKRNELVHRLVAIAFLPNPNELPDVNHKNEVKHHNFLSNLEWCTHKYNCNHGTSPKRIGSKLSKKTYQYAMDGCFVKEYKSLSEAARVTNLSKSNIAMVCNGQYKQSGGYKWSYTPLYP